MEELGDDGAVEYEKLLDNGASPAEIDRFVTSRIPHLEALQRKVCADFEYEMRKGFSSQ